MTLDVPIFEAIAKEEKISAFHQTADIGWNIPATGAPKKIGIIFLGDQIRSLRASILSTLPCILNRIGCDGFSVLGSFKRPSRSLPTDETG